MNIPMDILGLYLFVQGWVTLLWKNLSYSLADVRISSEKRNEAKSFMKNSTKYDLHRADNKTYKLRRILIKAVQDRLRKRIVKYLILLSVDSNSLLIPVRYVLGSMGQSKETARRLLSYIIM